MHPEKTSLWNHGNAAWAADPADGTPEQIATRVAAFDHAALTRQLAGSGFRTIELGGDLGLFFPSAYSPLAVQKLAALKQELGLSYTLHLPLWSLEPSTPLTPVRQGSAQAAIDVINATRTLEPLDYVFHATGALAAEFYRMNVPEKPARSSCASSSRRRGRACNTFCARRACPAANWPSRRLSFPST